MLVNDNRLIFESYIKSFKEQSASKTDCFVDSDGNVYGGVDAAQAYLQTAALGDFDPYSEVFEVTGVPDMLYYDTNGIEWEIRNKGIPTDSPPITVLVGVAPQRTSFTPGDAWNKFLAAVRGHDFSDEVSEALYNLKRSTNPRDFTKDRDA